MDSLNILVKQHNAELDCGATTQKSFWIWLDEQCNQCGFSSGEEAEWELESLAEWHNNTEDKK